MTTPTPIPAYSYQSLGEVMDAIKAEELTRVVAYLDNDEIAISGDTGDGSAHIVYTEHPYTALGEALAALGIKAEEI